MMVMDADGFRTVPPSRSGQQLGDYVPSSRPEPRNKNRFQPLWVADWQEVAQRVEAPRSLFGFTDLPTSTFFGFPAAFSLKLCGYTPFTVSVGSTDCSSEWPGGGDCRRLCPLVVAF